jgi:hypothetical protein
VIDAMHQVDRAIAAALWAPTSRLERRFASGCYVVINIDKLKRQLHQSSCHALLHRQVLDNHATATNILQPIQRGAVPRDFLDDPLHALHPWNDGTTPQFPNGNAHCCRQQKRRLDVASLKLPNDVPGRGIRRIIKHCAKPMIAKDVPELITCSANLRFRQRSPALIFVIAHVQLFAAVGFLPACASARCRALIDA